MGERERGREGERKRGREGERERGREAERKRGKEGERERGREEERTAHLDAERPPVPSPALVALDGAVLARPPCARGTRRDLFSLARNLERFLAAEGHVLVDAHHDVRGTGELDGDGACGARALDRDHARSDHLNSHVPKI